MAHKLCLLPWKKTSDNLAIRLNFVYDYGPPRGTESINVRFTQWHGKGRKVSLWGYKFDEESKMWRTRAQLFNLRKIFSVPRPELDDDALAFAHEAERS